MAYVGNEGPDRRPRSFLLEQITSEETWCAVKAAMVVSLMKEWQKIYTVYPVTHQENIPI